MKRTFLAISLALMLGASVQAKTPKEVLEPYKAYLAALESKDKTLAGEKAFEAWQRAEKLMGDTKTTGDLAANFAEQNPRYINERTVKKRVVQAHKRSIDLASLYTQDAADIEIDRRINYLTYLMANVVRSERSAWAKEYGAERLNERVKEFGMEGSTFHAESLALKARVATIDKKWSIAERDAKESIKIFDTRTDGIVSAYEYAVPVFLARAYTNQKRPIDAALTYQNLMKKFEAEAGHKNSISTDAYGEWIRLRDEIKSEKSSDPRALDVINFTVPSGRAEELAPLIRKPPQMPSSFLSGNKSGFVKVTFNVDQEGHVVDPVITSSTDTSLHRPTLKSLEGWRYTPNLSEVRRQDVMTTIRFDLQNGSGRRLPDGKETAR